MPRKTNRKKLINQVLVNTVIEVIWARSDQDVDEELVNCCEQLLCILKHRYLTARVHSVPKSTDWYIHILPDYDDFRFKRCLRATREDFSNLLQILSESRQFTKRENRKYIPIEKQLAIALYRFGCEGTGVSYYKLGQIFGTGDGGTILNSTNRVIKAFLDVEKKFILWPKTEERQRIFGFMEDKLPGCIGYLDGCHIPLFEAPLDNHESYFSRKQQYGLQLQAVCDNNLLLRNITVGYPASAHDARVFANSPIGMHPQKFFNCREWLAGDSAYKLSETVITPFRDNSTFGTSAQRKRFNQHFSSYRVKIEHTFGILKKVFGSLRCLRVRVDASNGHRRACEWIRCCCIIYNIIKPIENVEVEVDDDDIYVGEISVQGEERRKHLFNWVNGL